MDTRLGTGDFDVPSTAELLERHLPPFELTSDMLFALALCPTGPLRRTFPSVPFLSVLNRTPLLMWFSQIKQSCYYDTGGEQRCIGGGDAVLYNELNVIALLRSPALYVLGIYATADLTIRVGDAYGMAKRRTTMTMHRDGRAIESRVLHETRASTVRARTYLSGRALSSIVGRFLPRKTLTVYFASGSRVRPLIQSAPRLRPAHIVQGELAVETSWLPRPLPLLPVGLYAPDLVMQLPPPNNSG